MNTAGFLAWCRLHGFRSSKNAAAALGIPEAHLPVADTGKRRVGIRLELACLAYEYCYDRDPPESEIAVHYALVQQRIQRFLKLNAGPRDEELATALVLGLASMIELEKGEQAKQAFLCRAHDLISQSPSWSVIAAGSRQPILKVAGIEHQPQKEGEKTAPEILQFLDNRTRNDNRYITVRDRSIGKLLFLPPPRLRSCGDGGLTHLRGHDGGAVTGVWRGRTYCSAQSEASDTQPIAQFGNQKPTRGAGIASRDWRWSICLACDALQRAVAEEAGVFLVTCEARTVFADRLAMRLQAAHCIVAFDRRARGSLDGLLTILAGQLGIEFDAGNRAAWLPLLSDTLERRRSIIPVLLIDSADMLGDRAIRELGSVLDAGGDGAKIRVVLIGRPELKTRLNQPELASVNERVRFHNRLEAVDDTDIRSVIAARMPRDFAIANIANDKLAFIGDYIRANPEKMASLWRLARHLASDSGERSPSLAYVVKAIPLLVGDAGRMATAKAYGNASVGVNTVARGRSPGTKRKSLPQAVVVQAASVAVIVIVWLAMPSYFGREQTALRITASEQASPQSASSIGTSNGAHSPRSPLQTAILGDPNRGGNDKDRTNESLNPTSYGRMPPALAATGPAAPAEIMRREQGNNRIATNAPPVVRRYSALRPATVSWVTPLPPECAAQTSTHPQVQTALGPTAPVQPAADRSIHGDTQFAAASKPTCEPYVSQVDFSGHQAHVGGLACHDANGRWWLMNQQRESE